jgi:hypothetical protein
MADLYVVPSAARASVTVEGTDSLDWSVEHKSDVGLNSAQSQKPKDMQQEESFAPVVNVIGDGDAGAVVVQKLIINVCGGDGLSSFERLH